MEEIRVQEQIQVGIQQTLKVTFQISLLNGFSTNVFWNKWLSICKNVKMGFYLLFATK